MQTLFSPDSTFMRMMSRICDLLLLKKVFSPYLPPAESEEA